MDEDSGEVYDDLGEDVEVVYVDDFEIDDTEDQIQDENEEERFEKEVVDLSKLTFSKHARPVFSGILNKNGLLAATGGEDDMAYVWFTETGDILLECTGHKDSVTHVGFSFDEQYVATGDMSGLIQVWSLKDKKLCWCFEVDDMDWLVWHHLANVLFAGTRSGDVYVWQIPDGNCKILPSHGPPSTCGNVLSDGKRLLAGYGDGKIRLWDIKTTSVLWQLTETIPVKENEQNHGITSLEVTNDLNLFVVAPTANIYKVANGQQTGSMLTANEVNIEVAAINNESALVATGSLSGKLCMWDLKKNNLRHEASLETSVTILKWGPHERLFAGADDGCIYVCDAKSGTLIEVLTGHQAVILSLYISKDGSTVLSTSDDGTAKLFSVKTE